MQVEWMEGQESEPVRRVARQGQQGCLRTPDLPMDPRTEGVAWALGQWAPEDATFSISTRFIFMFIFTFLDQATHDPSGELWWVLLIQQPAWWLGVQRSEVPTR